MKKRLVLAMLSLSVGAVHDAVLPTSLHPPAPMMKALQGVEPRTPIRGSGPVTIAAPGSYYLTSNINVVGTTGVVITASNVTLDLNGFTVAGSRNNFGVVLSNNTFNVVVHNGTIRSFAQGILNAGVASVSLAHLTITENSGNGVGFDSNGIGVLIDSCTIECDQEDGIRASGSVMVVTNSTVIGNGHDGIELSEAADVVIRGNMVGGNGRSGIHAAIRRGCTTGGHHTRQRPVSQRPLRNRDLLRGRHDPGPVDGEEHGHQQLPGELRADRRERRPLAMVASDPGAWANVQ